MIRLLVLFLVVSCNSKGGGQEKSATNRTIETPETDLAYPVTNLRIGHYRTACVDRYSYSEQYDLIVSDTAASVRLTYFYTRTCDAGTHEVMRTHFYTTDLVFSQSFNQVKYLADQICGGNSLTHQIDSINCPESWESVVLEFYENENGYDLGDLIFIEI